MQKGRNNVPKQNACQNNGQKAVQIMKKPEIKYVGWCHECKHLGSFICGNCKPNEKYSFARPSEFMPKDKKRWVRMEE